MAKKSYKKTAKNVVKAANKHRLFVAVLAIILVIIIASVSVLWVLRPDLFHKYVGTGSHDWSKWEAVTNATCTEQGSEKRECTICGETETQPIAAKGHKWGSWVETQTAPCGDGVKTRVCSACEESEEEIIVGTGEHLWDEGLTVKEATCGDGKKLYTCSQCEETEEEVILGSGEHTWDDWQTVTEATCGDGKNVRVCLTCDDIEEEVIAGSGEHNFDDDGKCTVCGFENATSSEAEIATAELSIHFLELGNKYTGDSTLIKCGNTEVLIDAGSRQNSATTIKSYVDQYCEDGVLEYVIATHAHQDHIAGFVGSNSGTTKTGILYQYEIGTLIQFAGHKTTSNIYKNYCTAVEYAQSKGTNVYTAQQCWYERDGAAKQYYLDEAHTVSLNILYNYYYDNETSDENDYSVCMLLTQQTASGEKNYLFTGDLEEKGESYLVDYNTLPQVELFKGGHHGSYTASTEKLLNVIKPKNVAVCCCCGTTEYTTTKDNTFPSQAFIDRVSKHTENIYCTTVMIDYKKGEYTSMNGNIVFYTLGGKLKLWCSNNDIILKDTEWFTENRVWNA